MKPYYEDAYITLYHGDCLALAETWSGADVLITDPPYGMAFNSGQKRQTRDEFRERAIAGDATTEARDKVLSTWGERPAAVFGTWRVTRPGGGGVLRKSSSGTRRALVPEWATYVRLSEQITKKSISLVLGCGAKTNASGASSRPPCRRAP